MSHSQMFLKADNQDGYISCIVHRERYREAFKEMGFVDSVDDLPNNDEPESKSSREKLSLKNPK